MPRCSKCGKILSNKELDNKHWLCNWCKIEKEKGEEDGIEYNIRG